MISIVLKGVHHAASLLNNEISTKENNYEERKVIRHKYGAYYNVLLSDSKFFYHPL